MTPAELVALLQTSTPDLSARIREVTIEWKDSGTQISGKFYFVAFRDGAPTVDDLVSVAHARMINFALPRERIQEAIEQCLPGQLQADAWVLLATEARDLFIKTSKLTGRSGELGEILLYMLVEWVLHAPIVASKMYLKTAQNMPVHGTDGVHLGFIDGKLIVYWGESKLHGSLPSALTDIAKSISEHRASPEKYANEVRIIRANLNLQGLPEDARTAIKDYFNPYKEQSNQLLTCYACLAGFDSELYEQVKGAPPDQCEALFRDKIKARFEQACPLIMSKLKERDLSSLRFRFFLLPFPSVDDARTKFQQRLFGGLGK